MGLGLCVFEEKKRGPEEEKGTGWRVAVDISTCRLANPSPTCSVVLFGRTECREWESWKGEGERDQGRALQYN
jgi:hypothetical protein